MFISSLTFVSVWQVPYYDGNSDAATYPFANLWNQKDVFIDRYDTLMQSPPKNMADAYTVGTEVWKLGSGAKPERATNGGGACSDS